MTTNEAPELSKVQPPMGPGIQSKTGNSITSDLGMFPYLDAKLRLQDYDYFSKLFLGDHFTAFNVRIDDERWTRTYRKLRYVKANFAGLLSKILADMLFSEPVRVIAPDGDQKFIDSLWYENKMDVQCYESALSNSALGDAVFKIRVGKRNPADSESTVIIEDITPTIYFPQVDPFNARAIPEKQELAWVFKKDGKEYLRKEIHTAGFIQNEVYAIQDGRIGAIQPLSIIGLDNAKQLEKTNIDYQLIVHIPNWKIGNMYFGLSDYYDLDSIFYAINNRLTSIDNILDKHSDPILMVPPGVLDEKGQVNKKALGVIEVQEGENQKPEYIVWDASLENGFKEIEKLMEFFYITAEISPDALGMGQGMSDSGRALKFKLMRTIAKAARKKLYYDRAIKEIIYIAQLVAKANNVKVAGQLLKDDPVVPEIDWADGLPIDQKEQLENETSAIDAGLTTKKDAIMRIYSVDEETAEEILEDIKDENGIDMPKTTNIDNDMDEMDDEGNDNEDDNQLKKKV
jgi:hypothetical protein